MKKLFLLLTVITFTFQSCSSSDDAVEEISPFAGTWVGTYDGDDTGRWVLVVSNSGIVTRSSTFSNNINATSPGTTGHKIPDSGAVTTTQPNGSVSTIQITGDTLTGTWINPKQGNISGTLSGSRE